MMTKAGKIQRLPEREARHLRAPRGEGLPADYGRAGKSALSLLVMLMLNLAHGAAQVDERPFVAGEKAVYGAYFNWKFVWLHAGEVRFSCDTLTYNNSKAWQLKAVGKTFKAYDLFYTVRDTFETILSSPGFKPLWFRRSVNHGRQHSVQQYDFYPERWVVATIKSPGKPAFIDSLAYSPDVYDLLSAAYVLRGLDFDGLEPGSKVNFKILDDNKTANIFLRYLGTDKVKTRKGKALLCHGISVWLLAGDFFPEGEHMKIWFTADGNRVPVMVEAKILVGHVKALLEETDNTKYPVTYFEEL